MNNNKSKYHQAPKVEKDNENIKLRKRIKSFTTDKHLANRKETVRDRLNKVKKDSSSEKILEEADSHFIAQNHMLLKECKQSSKKPLIPNNGSVKKHLNIVEKTSRKKPEIIRESYRDIFIHDLSFDEVITCRSESKCSSDSNADIFKFSEEYKEPLCCNEVKRDTFAESSMEEYTLAPLLVSCSVDAFQSNASECLRYSNKQKNDPYSDCDHVINVGKSNSRCKILEDNPKLLKELLKTHLENASIQDFDLGKVLGKLESSVNLQQRLSEDFPEQTKRITEYSSSKKNVKKIEVEVVFKNVPSLEKEIEILRDLGAKIEATLKSTKEVQPSISQGTVDVTIKPSKVLKYKAKHDFKREHLASVSIQLNGTRQCVGIIKEFSVAKKSIVELKREASRQFFFASNCENVDLMKTSFNNLKENPNELFRHVRPQSSQAAFNLLEQDPIFFYSSLSKLSKNAYLSLKNHNQCNEYHLATEQSGDTLIGTTSNQDTSYKDTNFSIDKNVSDFKSKTKCNLDSNLFETQINLEPIIRGKSRRRIRRFVTPMPIGYYHCPKNSVIKTVLVGFAQVSLFILLIVALTHPGLKCLNSSV